MGFFKKLFDEASDSIKKSVEERKQELLKSVEDRKQEFLQNVEDRKREALAKIGLKPIDSDSNNNIDCIKSETIEKQEAKENTVDDNGVFSSRLEALISSSLQDGVLTDKEREILKRRVEKEGEDWDEVEMIIEARLAEMNPVAFAPSSRTSENNNVSKDTTPQAIEQKKRQIEEQAKAKEVPALKVDKPISKKYVKTEEDKYATSIDIPEGVTIIPGWCFYECSCLESITLPSTIKQIDNYAFEACSALTSIDIPEGVTIIPNNCFYKCSSLESITLPSTIKQISEKAFWECSSLTSIDIPEGVTIKQIGEYAFSGCSSLTSIDIPEGVTIIPNNCFNECSSLESITLPSTIKQIGEYAFSGCSALTSIDIPEGVTIISHNCFYKCSSLESITLPTTIKKIENDAFDECNKLKTLSFPIGMEQIFIEENAFEYDVKVFLPASMKKVNGYGINHVYCFSPHLEELEELVDSRGVTELYVLPKYLESYKSQAIAESISNGYLYIYPMPDEYLYYYDN